MTHQDNGLDDYNLDLVGAMVKWLKMFKRWFV